ncbi:MAG: sugar ABC transporter permease [Nitrososphaerota archaeon]
MKSPGLTFILPAMVYLSVLVIYPTIYLYYMTFHTFNPLYDLAPRYAGLQNFFVIAQDADAGYSILAMLFLTSITVPAQLALGSLIAILFTSPRLRGRLVLRSIMLIPLSIPAVIVGLNWKMIFFTYGPLNTFLTAVGLEPQPWLSAPFGNSFNTFFVLAVLDIWQWTPFVALAVAAGIESIPQQIQEAAALDGASRLQMIRHIVLPLSKTIIIIILLFRLIDSLKIFDIIYMLTFGGPGKLTTTLPFYIYKVGFTLTAAKADIGYASLLSVVLLLIATVLVLMVLTRVLNVRRVVWE